MRVAFVGKGGSGKSTFSTLFFLNLMKKKQCAVCFDADLNIHVPQLLGIPFSEEKSLSLSENTQKIKECLIGESDRIESPDHMYKTTPPSSGVNLFKIQPDNEIVRSFFHPYETGYIAAVGTYEADEIGRSCYHVNLSILENILSFAQLSDDDWIVVDMVAGIDAFSNTLHKQFDVLFLIVEPTQESVGVYEQYLQLAKHAGMDDRLFVIGNKVEDATDEAFLTSRIDSEKYVGSLNKNDVLKKLRQEGEVFTTDTLSVLDSPLLDELMDIVKRHRKDPNTRLKELYQLHLKYIDQDYVKSAVGDISSQIDERFAF